ncbi:hypothetical protein D3C80_383620 [compost metagenome]
MQVPRHQARHHWHPPQVHRSRVLITDQVEHSFFSSGVATACLDRDTVRSVFVDLP